MKAKKVEMVRRVQKAMMIVEDAFQDGDREYAELGERFDRLVEHTHKLEADNDRLEDANDRLLARVRQLESADPLEPVLARRNEEIRLLKLDIKNARDRYTQAEGKIRELEAEARALEAEAVEYEVKEARTHTWVDPDDKK